MIERGPLHGVEPWELWDAPWEGLPLYRALMDGDAPAETLAKFVESNARSVDAIFAGGGKFDDSDTRTAFTQALKSPCTIYSPARWVAEEGGAQILRRHAQGNGLVLDVGATATKLSIVTGGRVTARACEERPLQSLPRLLGKEQDEASPTTRRKLRDATVRFVAETLAQGVRALSPPFAVVLGFSAPIDATCTPGVSTYCGTDGDPEFFHRVLAACPLPCRGPVWLYNDAELAALSAAVVRPQGSTRYATVLAVTWGFAPGAAYATSETLDAF